MRIRIAFTVVEVLVALIVLSVAALGSAAAVGSAAREQMRATSKREALDVVRAQAARLSALPCDSLAAGQRMVRNVALAWSVTRDSVAVVDVSARHRGTVTALRMEFTCE